ncbi:uncharacterized protein isoform X1 [Leptinotarsa decemlineata]|uniref:uncharacterized protein isoform X1 n=1 Tax=Leptinotarsa decemlineata TaxID=7539 RepID=UPI003D30AD3F
MKPHATGVLTIFAIKPKAANEISYLKISCCKPSSRENSLSTKTKMVHKWLMVMVLGVSSFVIVLGAPRAINSEKDLERSIVKFLAQDKEFLRTLEKATELVDGPGDGLLRQKRQSEVDEMSIDSIDKEEKSEGFFDRAAKFVVDLLQRFLKWINSDSN